MKLPGTLPVTLHSMSAIQSNFDVNFPPKGGIRQYLPYRNGFYISDGVILYNDRVVIPLQLHYQVFCGCRPWNGVRAQLVCGRGWLKIFTIFTILVLIATEMRRRKPQPPVALPPAYHALRKNFCGLF